MLLADKLSRNKMTVLIDNRPIEAIAGQTVLEAALAADIYIPHLCTHPTLVVQGECKLCAVEVGGKVVQACEALVEDGMAVTTKSEDLSHRRNVAMELMLAGHPHDCTSCKAYLKI
jgi:NADH dehydrogenase/NADH:ubiquinone oxidoreductase subunit G